jgi:hypothetical protein
MDVKETPFGFEMTITGSDLKKYSVFRFHHVENPVRMHLVEIGKKYDGSPIISPIEKKGDSWVGRGKEFLPMTPEYEACEALLDAQILRVSSFKAMK